MRKIKGFISELITNTAIVVMFLGFLINPFVFADDSDSAGECNACTSSPKQFESYVNAMRIAIGALKVKPTYDGNDYPGKGLVNMGKGIYDSIEYDSNTSLSMPLLPSLGGDQFANMQIVNKPYPLVRDRNRLIALDELLQKKLTAIGKVGGFNLELSDSDLNRLESALQDVDYLDNIDIKEGIDNGKVLGLLWRINMMNKAIFNYAIGRNEGDADIMAYRNAIVDEYDGFVDFGKSLNMTLLDYSVNLKLSYECVINPEGSDKKCPSGSIDQLKKDFNEIASFEGEWEKIQERNERSYKRLKSFMRDTNFVGNMAQDAQNAAQNLKDKILGNIPGTDEYKSNMNKKGTWGIGKLWEKTKNAGGDFMQHIDEEVITPIERLQEAVKTGSDDDGITSMKKEQELSYQTDEVKRQFISDMENTYYGVLANEGKMTKDVTQERPNGVTILLPDLSKQIYKIIALIGSKDSDNDNNIVQNLGEACQLQCANQGGKCRYY